MSIPTTQTAVQVLGVAKDDDWLGAVTVTHDQPVPTLASGQVLVRLMLRPINPADTYCMLGVYPGFQPYKYPAVPGMEGMGVVAAVGPNVTRFTVGKRVTSTRWPGFERGNGTYQQYVAVPDSALEVVPDGVSDEQAACAIINPWTVLGLLEVVGDVPEGGYVVITAAGSALGRQLLAVCKERGIQTIAVVRRAAQAEELLGAGASEVVVMSEDVAARVQEITGGEGAYAALDCLAGHMVATLCRALRVGGTVVLYGSLTDPAFTLTVNETLFRKMAIRGYWYRLEHDAMTPEQRHARMTTIWDLFQ